MRVSIYCLLGDLPASYSFGSMQDRVKEMVHTKPCIPGFSVLDAVGFPLSPNFDGFYTLGKWITTNSYTPL